MLKPIAALTLPLLAVGLFVLAGCPAAGPSTDAPSPQSADGGKSASTESTPAAAKPTEPKTSAPSPADKPAEPTEPAASRADEPAEATAAAPKEPVSGTAGELAEPTGPAKKTPAEAVSTTADTPSEPTESAPAEAVSGATGEPTVPGETPSAAASGDKNTAPPKYRNPLRPESGGPKPGAAASKGKPSPPASPAKTKDAAKDAAAPPPFDPVKVNGPIFVGWTRPRLALVISGRIAGYLEPCGCAGLDRQKGGISRRSTVIAKLKKDGWPVVALDLGGLVNRYGRQAELKFHTTVDALRAMGYRAVGFGPDDLRLTAGELVAETTDPDVDQSPFVSANVGLLGLDSDLVARCRIVECAGLKIGITSILGQQFQKSVTNDDVKFAAPEAALAAVLPKLKSQCDYLVLLSYATPEESTALAKRFPEFDVVVTAGGMDEPPEKPVQLDGAKKTLMVSVGSKGMNVIVLGLYNSPKASWRYQRVPLDSRFASSPEMKQLMGAYQDQLRELGFANLVAREIPHPQTSPADKALGRFSASDRCESCHEISFDIWRKSKHARAYQTLVKADPPRQYDPECISCHVVGWSRDSQTQEPFPYATGFRSHERTPKMENVGCDSCHGPGTAHVIAELGQDEALKIRLRPSVRITKDEAVKKHFCQNCHDLDNSPEFKFETYWPKVEHYEKQDEEELNGQEGTTKDTKAGEVNKRRAEASLSRNHL
ncbi:MAG: multiheme c-type cytochrome [Pirellulales bacterium]